MFGATLGFGRVESVNKGAIMKRLMFTLTATAWITAGCGQGFQGNCQSGSCGSSASGGGSANSVESQQAWEGLTMEGNLSGGGYEKLPVVRLDKENEELIVRLPMQFNPFLGLPTGIINVPQLPGVKLSSEILPDGSMAMLVHIPLEKLMRKIDFLPAGKLPNGDPLPAIPSGELPTVGVTLNASNGIKAALYLDRRVVALFVNTKFDPRLAVTFPIRNKDKSRVLGYFSTIPAKPSVADGGFFISVIVPDDISKIIDDHLPGTL